MFLFVCFLNSNQDIPIVRTGSLISISVFSYDFYYFQTLGSSGRNLLLVNELIWVFQLLQIGSPAEACSATYTAFCYTASEHLLGGPRYIGLQTWAKLLIFFQCFPNAGDIHAPVSSMFVFFCSS